MYRTYYYNCERKKLLNKSLRKKGKREERRRERKNGERGKRINKIVL